ncbi:hypothetical protein GWK47_024287 [Chionoecetes opilio]|uniref:Uncharacterized protein n=1 Tax=Chionoecetes opilio TaxID=41210 RepID=A0A8J4XLR3_CHIOP|nr:hypothetical protein GWK47_024287 [Chionoecetes opilio]
MPTEQIPNPPYQFHGSPGSNLVYGYNTFPQYQAQGRVNVPGTVTYLDAYGQPTLLSHPMFGLGTYAQKPLAPVGGHLSVPSASAFIPNAAVVQHQRYAATSQKDLGRSALSPLLKLAVDAGFVRASGSSQTGSPQYQVSSALAEDAGSVSELAYRLGANPVAAVHDVQMRPNTISTNDRFSPVLIHKETPRVTLYTLEVPIQ